MACWRCLCRGECFCFSSIAIHTVSSIFVKVTFASASISWFVWHGSIHVCHVYPHMLLVLCGGACTWSLGWGGGEVSVVTANTYQCMRTFTVSVYIYKRESNYCLVFF